jgi:hypothetical protein
MTYEKYPIATTGAKQVSYCKAISENINMN